MRELIQQCLMLWHDLKVIQKWTVVGILLFVGCALMALFVRSSSHYVPLYPASYLQTIDLSDMRRYLESASIPYKENGKKEFLVPEEDAEQIRMELLTGGMPKQEAGKGFELFDTNTWIKGDKELQVLEMRAIKGQLERDLAGFEQIKNASVILDLAPPRLLGGSQYKTKASVILTLMPHAHLSLSQLRAITYHLAGAVRGLEPSRIAISDTQGRLYQTIHENGEKEDSVDTLLIFEGNLKEKIDQMLSKLVGEEGYFSSVQAVLGQDSKQSVSVRVLIDQNESFEALESEIIKQIAALAGNTAIETVVDFVPFKKKVMARVELEKKGSKKWLYLIFGCLAITCLGIVWFLPIKKKKEEKVSQDPLLHIMTSVDLQKLARSIQDEDPQTLAEMISYLEPARAEKLIAAFPRELQEQILFHLTEMEKEGV